MTDLCEHETFKSICGICHRDNVITSLRAENERLRGQAEFEKKCRNDAFDELKKQDADIERLREALAKVNQAVEKYADEKRFSQMMTLGTVQSIARSALQQKDSE